MRLSTRAPTRSSLGEGLPQVPLPRDVDGDQGRRLRAARGPRPSGRAASPGNCGGSSRATCSRSGTPGSSARRRPRLTGCGGGSLRIPAYHTRTSYFPSGRPGQLRASVRGQGEVRACRPPRCTRSSGRGCCSPRVTTPGLSKTTGAAGRARVEGELESLGRREGVDLVADVVAVGKGDRGAGLDGQDVGDEHAILLVQHRGARGGRRPPPLGDGVDDARPGPGPRARRAPPRASPAAVASVRAAASSRRAAARRIATRVPPSGAVGSQGPEKR